MYICTLAFITIIIITPIIVVAYAGTYIARLIRIWYNIYAASACKCKYYTYMYAFAITIIL